MGYAAELIQCSTSVNYLAIQNTLKVLSAHFLLHGPCARCTAPTTAMFSPRMKSINGERKSR